MGNSANPALERHLIDHVGSYGRQIGKLVEAVEVLAAKLPRARLTEKEKDALDALTELAADLRQARRDFPRAG
jgi:prophage DNA circulation protein